MKTTALATAALLASAGAALASVPIPLPLAGVAGPVGLGLAVCGYAAWRYATRNRRD